MMSSSEKGAVSGLPVHQTICTVDIVGYGDRTDYVAVRAGMYEALERAFADSGIAWDECFRQDVGGSVLVLVPMTVPKGAFAGPLPNALAEALAAHNETHPPEERIELRLALHAGEITFDAYGVAAPSVVHAARLLKVRLLKDVLAASPGPLALIASDWFYEDVISHHPEYAPETYRRVKESDDVGWIRVPGHELPPDPGARPAAGVVTESVLTPASPVFYEVVDALEGIPCLQDDVTRAQVIDELAFGTMVRYFAGRRAHITSILRTSLDFEDGVRALVTAIANHEPGDSVEMKRLLALLTAGRL